MQDQPKEQYVSRCGILCFECDYREECHCPTCHKTNGRPFHGECRVAMCSIKKGFEDCSECDEFPCDLLNEFAYDKEHGDNGKRIEQLKELKEKRQKNEKSKS